MITETARNWFMELKKFFIQEQYFKETGRNLIPSSLVNTLSFESGKPFLPDSKPLNFLKFVQ